VLIGFAIVAVVIAAGYAVGRLGVLGPHAQEAMGRLGFFVLSPPLLFTVLAEADLGRLFSEVLPVSAIAALVPMAAFLAIALAIRHRAVPEAVVGALGSGYVNAANIGIPVSVYVLGDAAASAPVILLQLAFLAPLALTVLDLSTSGRISVGRVLLQPVRNPLLIGSALGLVVAITGVELPEQLMAPFELVGAAAVPVILLSFGMSLHGRRILEPGPERADAVIAIVLKLALAPLAAWAAGRLLFGMEGHELFVVVVLAALPAAQNVFNFAQRYDRGVVLARDVVLVTTLASLPVLVAIAALLAA